MSLHAHVAHYYVQETTVYADTPHELLQWIATWREKHTTQHPLVIPLDDLSAICQSRISKCASSS